MQFQIFSFSQGARKKTTLGRTIWYILLFLLPSLIVYVIVIFYGRDDAFHFLADHPRTEAELNIDVRIIGYRPATQDFFPIENGDSLRASFDSYLFHVIPNDPGFLYVFQWDSEGQLFWVFPKNKTSEHSSGLNPVQEGRDIVIPQEEERISVFRLDSKVGIERVVFVFCSQPIPELEKFLSQSSQDAALGSQLAAAWNEHERAVGGTETLPRGPYIQLPGMEQTIQVPIGVRISSTEGVVVFQRWFRHVD